ncbi:hypothetical protein Lal_00026760 [Lupinus albus]|nr:hypothetical protein Lal_00026760 [Lupinus albus]
MRNLKLKRKSHDPSQFHPKAEIITTNVNKGLKTNRVSHSIKKTSSSSFSSLPPNKPQQQREPLTGLSRDHFEEETDEDANTISSFNSLSHLPPPKHEPEVAVENVVEMKYPKEENEMYSVITNENNGGYSCMGEVKSCFMEAPSPMTTEIDAK